MKSAIILLGLIFGVFARPEAPLSYQTSVPSGGYLPSHTSPSTNYGTPGIAISPGFTAVNGFDNGYTTGPGIAISPGFTADNGFDNGYHTGITNVNAHQDQKHVYFYAAPDEETSSRLRIYVQPSSHRNTRIIFVKAPSYGGVIPEIIAPPSQAEDKTKIYVLVKKQQHGGSITIPASLGVKQGKPEVFFIKYRNQHDAQAAVNQGLHGGTVGSHLENLGSEQAFIRTLETSRGGINTGIIGTGITDGLIGGKYGPPSVTTGTSYGPPGVSGPYKR